MYFCSTFKVLWKNSKNIGKFNTTGNYYFPFLVLLFWAIRILVGRPVIKLLGITKENLNPILYWILFIIIGLIFYQLLLVTFGWLFGQFKFFWEFEKKMLRRFGLKRFLD